MIFPFKLDDSNDTSPELLCLLFSSSEGVKSHLISATFIHERCFFGIVLLESEVCLASYKLQDLILTWCPMEVLRLDPGRNVF